ncbi:hypothetical protein NDU88_000393 [Pleurodeles waltl]|uniref:Uncharacterized protein n=1 Tax=Pleurodeles waltl TaxID=8319 RepID=A0AAV7S8H3_PLEWA|nr:hypothetical protein NDU88_000393 [Pleurodeles waltl]
MREIPCRCSASLQSTCHPTLSTVVLAPKWQPPPLKSGAPIPASSSALMSSRLPPSVGVQLECHPYSFYWGSRIFPASSVLSSSAPSLEPPPGPAAPRAYLPGSPGAAPAQQRRQDPRGSFNHTGTFPRPGAAPAQAPLPAQARVAAPPPASSVRRHRQFRSQVAPSPNSSQAITNTILLPPPALHHHPHIFCRFWQFVLAPMCRIIKGLQSGRRSSLKERPSCTSAGHAPMPCYP